MAGGQQIDSGHGSLTQSFDVALVGSALTSATGTVGVSGSESEVLIGSAATFAAGALASASRLVPLKSRKVGGGSATSALTGIPITSAAGAFSYSKEFALTGASASSAQGAFGKTRSKAVSGIQISAFTGTVTGQGTEPSFSQVPPIQFIQGTAGSYSLVQHTTGFNSLLHRFVIATGTLPSGVTLDSAVGFVYDGVGPASSALAITINIEDIAQSAQTGLYWDGTASVRRMLYWDNPFPIYGSGMNAGGADGGNGVTYMFKVYPRQITRAPAAAGDRYWTFFFWGNSDNNDTTPPGQLFSWFGGVPNTYYGAHPYPVPTSNGTSSQWEISANSSDTLGPTVVYDRWYKQMFRAWRASSTVTNHEYYWDLDLWTSSGGTQGRVTFQISSASWANTNPPIPRITMGQASWLDVPSHEEANVIMRDIGMWDSLRSVQQVINEHATAGSSGVTAWYRNVNPTAADANDKSGSNHHPLWRGTTAATWTSDDFQARISGPQVVWYHDFDNAAEVSRFRWTGNVDSDPNGTGDGAEFIQHVASGGVNGGGFLRATYPLGADSGRGNSIWWRPFNPLTGATNGKGVDDPGASGSLTPVAWNVTQGSTITTRWSLDQPNPGWYMHPTHQAQFPGDFQGHDFYLQVRVRRAGTPGAPPDNLPNFTSITGKHVWLSSTGSTFVAQEIVTAGQSVGNGDTVGVLSRHTAYVGQNFNFLQNQPNATVTLNNMVANGWRFSGGWDTLLYHMTPGTDGGTGSNRTRIEVWAQHDPTLFPAESGVYTKIWDVTYTQGYTGGTNNLGAPFLPGWNALICGIYHNGSVFTTSSFNFDYDQMIFSKATIPAPV